MGDKGMTELSAPMFAAGGLYDAEPASPHVRTAIPQGLNRLVGAAHPLLEVGTLLRDAPAPASLEALRAQLVGMMRAFVERAQGTDAEILAAARYCLSTFLDEVIAATPWGRGGAWSSRSLLVTFHGEASGGERFFTILHHLSRDPAANIDALELLYVILSLGMEGRYRLLEGGAIELEHLRARLLQLIRDTRGTVEQSFSPEPRGVPGRRRPAWYIRPLWLALAISLCMLAATLAITNSGMRGPAHAITVALGKVYVAIRAPKAAAPAAPPPVPAAVRPASRFDSAVRQLATILAPEIANGSVRLDQNVDRALLTLNSDGLFASGSSWVLPELVPLLRRIGVALRDVPGDVTIVGHTDDVRPAPGAPTNQQLSLRRAGRVKDLLVQETGDPDRFLVQGRGDTEPIASNDTEAGRARNRRVVITLLAPGTAR